MNNIFFASARLSTLALLSVFAAAPALAASQPKAPRTIRWVFAHTSDDAPYNALFESFMGRIEERSAGELKVEIVDKDSSSQHLDRVSHDMVLDGRADMGQFESGLAMYAPAITAPFAFRSYAHAEAVFTGPVGKKILDGIYASSDRKIRALAFTYSGGQRIFYGKTPITKLADFKGQRIESPGNSGWTVLMDELMSGVGVKLVPEDSREDLVRADQFEGVINRGTRDFERAPSRLKTLKYINRTNHGLLVTTVVANEKFLATLTADQKRILTEEVEALALKERKLSIDLEPKRLEAMIKLGARVVELAPSERRKFMDMGESVLKKHPEIYRVIQEIRSVKEDAHTAQL